MKRPGRPAIGKYTAMRFPTEMLDRIDALAGPGKRAAFARAAIDLVLSSIGDLEVKSLPSGEVEFVKTGAKRQMEHDLSSHLAKSHPNSPVNSHGT